MQLFLPALYINLSMFRNKMKLILINITMQTIHPQNCERQIFQMRQHLKKWAMSHGCRRRHIFLKFQKGFIDIATGSSLALSPQSSVFSIQSPFFSLQALDSSLQSPVFCLQSLVSSLQSPVFSLQSLVAGGDKW